MSTNTTQSVAKHLEDCEWITNPRDGEEGDEILTSDGFSYEIKRKEYEPEVTFVTDNGEYMASDIHDDPDLIVV